MLNRSGLDKSEAATFAEMVQAPDIQGLCRKMGVVHLGGPLLGCLEPGGGKIWLRNVKPAAVSVETEIEGKTHTFGPVNSTAESDLTAMVPVRAFNPHAIGGSCIPPITGDDLRETVAAAEFDPQFEKHELEFRSSTART